MTESWGKQEMKMEQLKGVRMLGAFCAIKAKYKFVSSWEKNKTKQERTVSILITATHAAVCIDLSSVICCMFSNFRREYTTNRHNNLSAF